MVNYLSFRRIQEIGQIGNFRSFLLPDYVILIIDNYQKAGLHICFFVKLNAGVKDFEIRYTVSFWKKKTYGKYSTNTGTVQQKNEYAI